MTFKMPDIYHWSEYYWEESKYINYKVIFQSRSSHFSLIKLCFRKHFTYRCLHMCIYIDEKEKKLHCHSAPFKCRCLLLLFLYTQKTKRERGEREKSHPLRMHCSGRKGKSRLGSKLMHNDKAYSANDGEMNGKTINQAKEEGGRDKHTNTHCIRESEWT